MAEKLPDWVKTSGDYERWKRGDIKGFSEGFRKCPFCAEEIKTEALKCKHCGSMLDGSRNSSDVSVSEIDPFAYYRADIKMKAGKLSILGYIGIVLGIFIIITGFLAGRYDSNEEAAYFSIGLGAFLSIGCFMWARRK